MGVQEFKANSVNQQELLLVRGHPGSGKTTFAERFVPLGYKHFENDSFFTNAEGVYNFKIEFHQTAKDICIHSAQAALIQGHLVVVSNTFTTLKEMDALIQFANEKNIPVRVVEMELKYTNVHDVPEAVVEAKIKQFERFEGATIISYDFDVV